MKPKAPLFLGAALTFGIFTSSTSNAALQWDGDPGTAGAQDGGGTWDAAATNWFNAGNIAWTDAEDAIFGAGTNGVYPVNVALAPVANSLAFNTAGYTLSAVSPQTITTGSATTTNLTCITAAAGTFTTIANNVTVTTRSDNRNYNTSGTGTLTIESGGSLRGSGSTNSNIFNINGTTIEIKPGGTLASQPLASNGTAIFINGTVSVLGGQLECPGTLGLGQSAAASAGTLTIDSGTVLAPSSNGIRIGSGSGTTPGGTVNLNGGTLAAFTIFKGGGTVTTSLLNLNGGLLKGTAHNATFINALARANVRDGGAHIDSAGFGLIIPQALLHSNIPGDAVTDGGLTKSGLGKLALGGANTYNGGTTIHGGELQFEVGAVPAAGSILINSAGALNVTGEFPTVASIVGSGKVALGSSGAVALTAASAENISFGAYANLMLGASANSIYTGTLAPSGANYRLGGGGAILGLPNANALTGSSGLVVGAPGSTGLVRLANSNNYTGTTTITSGTLQLGDGTADASIDGSSGIVNNATLIFQVAGSVSPLPSISGTGDIRKQGNGTLTLTKANSYSGPTTIATGTLLATHSNAFGSSTVTANSNIAQLQLGGGITIANAVRTNTGGIGTLGGAPDGMIKSISGDNTLLDFGFAWTSGTRIHVVAGSSISFPNDFAAGNLSSLRVIGAGTMILDGDNSAAIGEFNSFLIGTSGSAGPVIKAGNNAAFGAGSIEFQSDSVSTLQSKDATARTLANKVLFQGAEATLGAAATGDLTFNGELTLSSDLDLTIANTTTTFAGTLGESGGPRGLTKSGAGTLELAGATNLTGAITVSSGRLLANGTIDGAGGITVAPSATLGGNGSIGSGLVVQAGGTLSPGTSTGTLAVLGPVAIDGSLAIEIDGSNGDRLDVSGVLDITNATLDIATLAGGATKPVHVIATFGSLTGSAFAGVSGLPSGYSVAYDLPNKQIKLVSGAPSGFSTWIAGFSVSDPAPGADPDKDGVSNALEYVLGGDPSVPSTGLLPTSAIVGTNLIFTFARADQSETPDTALSVQVGTDMLAWPVSYTVGADAASSSAGVSVAENGSDPDTVSVTIPMGSAPRKFARLRVVITQ